MDTDRAGALRGVVVADFSRVLAGPYLTMTLGDLGADVIKVERPDTGDDTRTWGPPWAPDGSATYYVGLNRNKRSVTLDLSIDEGRVRARQLCERADVVVENFRPGTMERFGLGFEHLSPTNPGLVYCSISGFGGGPDRSDIPGYDLLVQAMSGLMHITGQPAGDPTKVGVAVVDHVCALQATVGVLAALRHRDVTGRGQKVEVSLLGSALAALLNQASSYLMTGLVPTRLGNRHPSIAPYQPFPARDGWIVIACGNDSQFRKLAEVCDLPGLADDRRFRTNEARVANLDELEEILGATLARRTVAEWEKVLIATGVPAGPINDVGEAVQLGIRLGLDPVLDWSEPGREQRYVRSPIGLSGTPTSLTRGAPRLGEHQAEIEAWLDSPDRA